MSTAGPNDEQGHPGPGAAGSAHPSRELARYLAAYRGNLTRGEAARRSGLPEVLWEQVEASEPADASGDRVPAAIVAAMCMAVGADIATGLRLAGHSPDLHPQLVESPIAFAPPTLNTDGIDGPCIATPHVVVAALAGDPAEIHTRMASVYRRLAQANWRLANRITEDQPDTRREYWSGYAAALRAVAEQQAWAADQESVR